jgi:hypothetical protein
MSSGFAIPRTPISRWMTLLLELSRMPRSRPRVPKNGRSSPLLTISRFRDFKCSGCLVFRIRETPNPDMRWAPNLAHVSQLTDDSDPISGFRNLRFPDEKVLCQLKTPVADIPMGRSISPRVPTNGRLGSFPGLLP